MLRTAAVCLKTAGKDVETHVGVRRWKGRKEVMRMSEYGSNAEGIREKLTERVKDAQEMRQEIDALKAELAGITGDLDPEITGEIQAAQEQARQEAMSDISGVEQQANQEQQEGKRIQGEVDTKIRENSAAAAKLEAARGNKYGRGVEAPLRSIESNNAQGEQIKAELEAAMQEAMAELNSSKSGI